MAKKGKTSEETAAEAGSVAGVPPVSEGIGATENAALVEGSGGASAAVGEAERPETPSDAAAEIAGSGEGVTDVGSVDVQTGAAGGTEDPGGDAASGALDQGDVSDDDGAGSSSVVDPVSDTDRGELVGSAGDGGDLWDGDVPYAIDSVGVEPGNDSGGSAGGIAAIVDPNANGAGADGGDDGALPESGNAADTDDDDSTGGCVLEPVSEGQANDTGGATGDDGAESLIEDAGDAIVLASDRASAEVIAYVHSFWMLTDAAQARLTKLIDEEHGHRSFNAIAALVRAIGAERATVDVIASQLRILGILDNVELVPVERLLITVFVQTLTAIEAFEATERAIFDAAAAERARVQPEPLPVDETTLEPVDGPMDTWGAA